MKQKPMVGKIKAGQQFAAPSYATRNQIAVRVMRVGPAFDYLI